MAKIISISDDAGANYFTFPGASGEQSRNVDSLDDTVFGQTFQSSQPGLITAEVTANAFYKGFAGYVADIKKQGASTAMADEAMTLETGKIYEINDITKRIWNRAVAMVVEDNAVDQTNEVEWFDFLFGRIKFKDSYTVTGAVTISGEYFPTTVIGKSRSFTLTQTADTIDTTDMSVAQGNNGFRTFNPGLRTVSLELGAVHDAAASFKADLNSRVELIIEVNPDGNGKSVARGFFKITDHGQAGDVGDLEEESLTFSLSVPDPSSLSLIPFKWKHAVDTTLSLAIRKALTAWESETKPKVRYLPDGAAGDEYDVVVIDVSLTGGLEAMNEFAASFRGDGAPVTV